MKTTNDESRYKRALLRNLNEVGWAILERRAMVGLEKARTHQAINFIGIAYDAMLNDMIAHAIKLFEDSSRVASFWYVKRCKEKEVAEFVARNKLDISKLEKTRDSLKHIRERTHFHIDKDAVIDPNAIWDEAKVTGRQLAEAIDIAWKILDHLHILDTGDNFRLPKYSGVDATKIAKYANTL